MTEGQAGDVAGSCFPEGSGAGVEGRSGGEYIIYENVGSVWISRETGGGRKCMPGIPDTGLTGQSGLGFRIDPADQSIFGLGTRRQTGNQLCDHGTLVESAFPQFARVKWDRNEDLVGCFVQIARRFAYDLADVVQDVVSLMILELVDQSPGGSIEEHRAAVSFEYGFERRAMAAGRGVAGATPKGGSALEAAGFVDPADGFGGSWPKVTKPVFRLNGFAGQQTVPRENEVDAGVNRLPQKLNPFERRVHCRFGKRWTGGAGKSRVDGLWG